MPGTKTPSAIKKSSESSLDFAAARRTLAHMKPVTIHFGERLLELPFDRLIPLLNGRSYFSILACVEEVRSPINGTIKVRFKLLENSGPFLKGRTLDFDLDLREASRMEAALRACKEVVLDFLAQGDTGANPEWPIVFVLSSTNRECCKQKPSPDALGPF